MCLNVLQHAHDMSSNRGKGKGGRSLPTGMCFCLLSTFYVPFSRAIGPCLSVNVLFFFVFFAYLRCLPPCVTTICAVHPVPVQVVGSCGRQIQGDVHTAMKQMLRAPLLPPLKELARHLAKDTLENLLRTLLTRLSLRHPHWCAPYQDIEQQEHIKKLCMKLLPDDWLAMNWLSTLH